MRELFEANEAIAYEFSLPSHSIKKNNPIIIKVAVGKITGIVNIVGENISYTILSACAIFSDLKKIHARQVNMKVNNMEKKSRTDGNNLPFATISRLFRFLLRSKSGKK